MSPIGAVVTALAAHVPFARRLPAWDLSLVAVLSAGLAFSSLSLARASQARTSFPTAGHVTYRAPNGHVYRLEARAGARPEDITALLDRRSGRGRDDWLNTSPDGSWLLLSSSRFNRQCSSWTCLAAVRASGLGGQAVIAAGQVIHANGFGAIASGGGLIVFPNSGGPHRQDLWAMERTAHGWTAPTLLTVRSPYAWNAQPAISPDGRNVIFDCGNQPYAAEGTALCEAATDGRSLRVVLTPAQGPRGSRHTAALHHAAFAPDGSLVFESDWFGEQIWRLPRAGGGTRGHAVPARVAPRFTNDNSPCVLPDGRIVSLWLERPGGGGRHELKVMSADGRSYAMLLTGVDVVDIGIGCGA